MHCCVQRERERERKKERSSKVTRGRRRQQLVLEACLFGPPIHTILAAESHNKRLFGRFEWSHESAKKNLSIPFSPALLSLSFPSKMFFDARLITLSISCLCFSKSDACSGGGVCVCILFSSQTPAAARLHPFALGKISSDSSKVSSVDLTNVRD